MMLLLCLLAVPALTALSMLADRWSRHAGDAVILAVYTAAAFAAALCGR